MSVCRTLLALKHGIKAHAHDNDVAPARGDDSLAEGDAQLRIGSLVVQVCALRVGHAALAHLLNTRQQGGVAVGRAVVVGKQDLARVGIGTDDGHTGVFGKGKNTVVLEQDNGGFRHLTVDGAMLLA